MPSRVLERESDQHHQTSHIPQHPPATTHLFDRLKDAANCKGYHPNIIPRPGHRMSFAWNSVSVSIYAALCIRSFRTELTRTGLAIGEYGRVEPRHAFQYEGSDVLFVQRGCLGRREVESI